MKIKKGDKVVLLAGKDKGKTGKVEQVFPKTGMVLVEGLNIATKHQKSRRTRSQGQVIKKAVPVDVSNVALADGEKPVKVGYKVEEGKRVRVNRKTGKEV
jgi:large subunit ribosomal protein L24